jgi:hypothetical protein
VRVDFAPGLFPLCAHRFWGLWEKLAKGSMQIAQFSGTGFSPVNRRRAQILAVSETHGRDAVPQHCDAGL